uniref:Uncharacterized protein n=1 Tax=Ascaris lumbricoides TaxID=6252 RepID=A0A0M3HU15_ASCLU
MTLKKRNTTPGRGGTPASTSTAEAAHFGSSLPSTPQKSAASKSTAKQTSSTDTPAAKTADTISGRTGSLKEEENEQLADEVAPNDQLDDKSIREPELVDKDVGEDTERLSDVSDDEGLFGSHSRTSLSNSRFMSWLEHISPLIRNRKVRYLAIVNFFLSAFNVILMLILVALLIYFIVLTIKKNEAIGSAENPCIFRYGNWGECSGVCWNTSEQSEPPKMRRKVLRSSIVQARGLRYKPCPVDLAEHFEEAPCNFFRCPIPLSSFAFHSRCFFNEANKGKAGGCYRIRQLPLDNYTLIRIDANLTEKCRDCPDFII